MDNSEDPLRVLVTLDKPESTDPRIQMEYDQVNNNFRMLADIRFKLLALVPPLGGVAIFALSTMASPKDLKASEYALALLVSVLGFLATLGITFYDQRNSELYNALGGRANYLEHHAGLELNPDAEPSKAKPAGQFLERPKPTRHLLGLFLMKHDRGLALIYGSVLGAWFFPILSASLGWANSLGWAKAERYRAWVPLGVAAAMVIIFIVELLRLDDTFSENQWGTVIDYLPRGRVIQIEFKVRDQPDTLTGKLTWRCHRKLKDARPQIGDSVRVRYYKDWLDKMIGPVFPGRKKKAKRVFRFTLLEKKPGPARQEAAVPRTKSAS